MASYMLKNCPPKIIPVVVVLGASGTGKSKLALEIAQKFNGEIISADSMQVYKGLDIITNKVTAEERLMAPHHLLDFLDPLKCYTVTDFRNAALPIVNQMLAANKMPIIVGGTNYYIESLLWENLIEPAKDFEGELVWEKDKIFYEGRKIENEEKKTVNEQKKTENEYKIESEQSKIENEEKMIEGEQKICENEHKIENEKNKIENEEEMIENEQKKIEGEKNEEKMSENDLKIEESDLLECIAWQGSELSTSELYAKLRRVDPQIAATYHPNERRKIIRSLQVWEQTGVCHSKHLDIQKTQAHGEGGGVGGRLRYQNTAMFWVTCDQEVLNERVDKRVDEMINRGLLKELIDFHSTYNKTRLENNEKADYTQGIFQSIGFKEFHEYLLLSENERAQQPGKHLYIQGIDLMKLATRQYTKKQIKWIKNRFLTCPGRKVPPVYSVDGTNVLKWNECVRDPVFDILECMIEGRQPKIQPLNTTTTDTIPKDKTRHYCDTCERIFIGSYQWQIHISSKKHNKILKRKNRLENNIEKDGIKKAKTN